MKRLFDILVSSVVIVLFSPLFLLIILWIRLDSAGPVFFIQKRIGLQKMHFDIFKFRTMVHRTTLDQRKEIVLSSNHDNRITNAGKILRSTSLDELPQVINVLKGNMSLVGPRPIIPEQLEAIRPDQEGRFKVKPGITGLSQVRGRRNLSWPEQLKFDAEYAEKSSFLYDIGILLKTIVVIFKKEGIYGDPKKNWRAYLPKNKLES